MNIFKTKTAKRRDAKKDFDNKKLPLMISMINAIIEDKQ